MSRLIFETLLQTALIFFFVASLACFFFGIALLTHRDWAMRFSTRMNQWVSTRRVLRPLEQSRDIQRQLYQRHPLVGGFIVVGALFVIYFLFYRYTPEPFRLVFGRSIPIRALDWILQSLWWIALVTNVFALVIGIIMFSRPSLLKGMEKWANRAYSTREAGKFWETMNFRPDRMVEDNPRAFGWLVIAGSLYVAISMAVMFTSRFLR